MDGRTCKLCHEQCDPHHSCVGPKSTDCMTCANFKLSEACVEECPSGFVSNGNKTCLDKSGTNILTFLWPAHIISVFVYG